MLDLGRRGERPRQLADRVLDLGRRGERGRQLADLVASRPAATAPGRQLADLVLDLGGPRRAAAPTRRLADS